MTDETKRIFMRFLREVWDISPVLTIIFFGILLYPVFYIVCSLFQSPEDRAASSPPEPKRELTYEEQVEEKERKREEEEKRKEKELALCLAVEYHTLEKWRRTATCERCRNSWFHYDEEGNGYYFCGHYGKEIVEQDGERALLC